MVQKPTPQIKSQEEDSSFPLTETIKELDNIANKIVITDIKQKLNSPDFQAKDTDEKLAIINAHKKSLTNQSQDSPNYVSKLLTTPNQTTYWSAISFDVPEGAFLETAFQIYTTEKLMTMLQKQQQINDPLSAEANDVKDIFRVSAAEIKSSRMLEKKSDAKNIFLLKVIENGIERTLTQEEEARWQDLESSKAKCVDYHYINLGVLILVHGLLRQLYKSYKEVQILSFIDKIETICFKYNIHNPKTCIRIEESQLRNLKSVESLFAQMRSYFFGKITTATPSPSTVVVSSPASPISPVSPPSTPVTTTGETPTASSNVLPQDATLTLDESTIGAVNQITSFHSASQNKTTKIFTIEKIDLPITIDLKNIAGTFDNIINYMIRNIDTALQNIDQMFQYAKQINYNIYTNAFGSYAIRDANFSYLEAVRKKIASIYTKEYTKESFLIPRFYLRFYFKKLIFTGATGYSSKVGHCVDMAPGERRTIRQKTTETTRTMREQTKSVLDSVTKSKQSSLTKSMEQAKENSNTINVGHEDYIDSKINGEASYKNPLISVKASGDCAWGSTNAVESTIDETINTVDQTIDSEVNEERGQKDTAFTETSKEEVERTQESGTDRNFENINTGSTLNMVINEMAQEYHSFNVLVDMRMIFANGDDRPDEFPLTEFENRMVKYLKPNHPAVNQLRSRIMENAKINDFRNRPIQVLEEKTFRFIRDDYYALCQRSKVDTANTIDLTFKEYYKNILGVVLKHQSYIKEVGGTISFPMISPGLALDANQLKIQEALVQKHQASGNKDLAEADIQQKRADFMQKILDSTNTTLAEQADAMMKVANTGRDVLNQAFLSKTLSDLEVKSKNGKLWKI